MASSGASKIHPSWYIKSAQVEFYSCVHILPHQNLPIWLHPNSLQYGHPLKRLPEWPNCSRTWWRNNQTPMVEYHAGVFVRSGKGGTIIIVDCWCTILQLCRLAFRCSISPESTPICYSINRRRWPTMTPPLLELYAKVPRIPGRKSPK